MGIKMISRSMKTWKNTFMNVLLALSCIMNTWTLHTKKQWEGSEIEKEHCVYSMAYLFSFCIKLESGMKV